MDIKSASERSANMAVIRSKNTKPEIIVRKALTAAGCRYRLNRSDIPGKPDIAMIGRRIAIFVHGCFWHAHEGCPRASVPSAHHAFWVENLPATKHATRPCSISCLRAAGVFSGSGSVL